MSTLTREHTRRTLQEVRDSCSDLLKMVKDADWGDLSQIDDLFGEVDEMSDTIKELAKSLEEYSQELAEISDGGLEREEE